MTKKLTLQEIILKLQQYWSAQGCMLMQAYDTEKGAGTMSPYTFFTSNRSRAMECGLCGTFSTSS